MAGHVDKPLANQRHELFAQFVAQGKNATEAYKLAGYKPSETNASRLLRNEQVAARVQALQSRAARRVLVTIEKVVREYARIAFSDMGDYCTWDASGVTLKDSAQLSKAQRRAISEVSETVNDSGRAVKFKLHSKVDALAALARYLGMDGKGQGKDDPHADAEPWKLTVLGLGQDKGQELPALIAAYFDKPRT